MDFLILGFLPSFYERSSECEVLFGIMTSDLDHESSLESLSSSFLQANKQLETRLPFLVLLLHLRLELGCMHVKVAPLRDF